jgi:type IV pilus assembly protein PilW
MAARTPPSSKTPGRAASAQRGFTLIELMVGVVIGLITILAIVQTLQVAESQKRTNTSGADAQVNGALALYHLQRAIQSAGYGFASSPELIGCPISATYGGTQIATGAATAAFPTQLVPVLIDATDPNLNTIRVLGSSKPNYALPTRIIAPGYDPANASKSGGFPVTSALGIAPGDLIVVAKDAVTACEVFQVSAGTTVVGFVNRSTDTGWNAAGFPTATYGDGNTLMDLGSLDDRRFSISNGNLQETRFQLDSATSAPSYPAATTIFTNIVGLRAFYGEDTNADGVVDTYTQTTPTTNAAWRTVLTVRLVVVARSEHYEKDVVTTTAPLWSVGSNETFSPAPSACAAGQCFTLDVSAQSDWQHYRYKVFDTVVPLRNLLWQS